MHSIGKKAIIASKNKINSKSKNKVLNQYINLIKKNKKLIIKQNSKDIKLAIRKKLRDNLTGKALKDFDKIISIDYDYNRTKIVTTEKDYSRMNEKQKQNCDYIEVDLEIENKNEFIEEIKKII